MVKLPATTHPRHEAKLAYKVVAVGNGGCRRARRDGRLGCQRRCALTRVHRPKSRPDPLCARSGRGDASRISERLPGRGVWLTADYDTVADAVQTQALGRALKTDAKDPDGAGKPGRQSPERCRSRCVRPGQQGGRGGVRPFQGRGSPANGPRCRLGSRLGRGGGRMPEIGRQGPRRLARSRPPGHLCLYLR